MREKCGYGTTFLGSYWEGYEQGLLFYKDDLLRARLALPAWQPIETAPTDGTPVLTFQRGYAIVVQWYERGEWTDGDKWSTTYTHWMPLPAPPSVDQEPAK